MWSQLRARAALAGAAGLGGAEFMLCDCSGRVAAVGSGGGGFGGVDVIE